MVLHTEPQHTAARERETERDRERERQRETLDIPENDGTCDRSIS